MAWRRHDAAEKVKDIGEAGDMQALEVSISLSLSLSLRSKEARNPVCWVQFFCQFSRKMMCYCLVGTMSSVGDHFFE
jgi:hypothetical protein